MIAVSHEWDNRIADGPSPTGESSTELQPGTLLGGRYRLSEVIGRGGMATVFRGHDERLERDVAVKVCGPCEGQLPPLREERVSSALIHNHVVSIFDAGDIPIGEPGAGCSYIVMEYVHGTTAQEIAPVPWPRAVEILRQAADGLAAAHERGIIHCDVKPSNLLIDRDGRVLLADFGIAAQADSEVGDFVHGSPAYIAPERLRGERPDPRVDIFGLGGVLAFLLTGQKPTSDHFPTLPPGTPETLTDIVGKARATNPVERYTNVAELQHALANVLPANESAHPHAQAATRQVSVARQMPTSDRSAAPSSPRRVVRRVQPQPQPQLQRQRRIAGTTALPARLDSSLRKRPVSQARPTPTTFVAHQRAAHPAVLLGAALIALLLVGLFVSILRGGDGIDPSGPVAAASDMPDVRGQTFGPAVEQLKAQGITVDRIEIVYADNYLNEVVFQDPAPGEDVQDDDEVTLVVRTSR